MSYLYHLFSEFKVPAPKSLKTLTLFLQENFKELCDPTTKNVDQTSAPDIAMTTPEANGQDLDSSVEFIGSYSPDEHIISFHAENDFSDLESPEHDSVNNNVEKRRPFKCTFSPQSDHDYKTFDNGYQDCENNQRSNFQNLAHHDSAFSTILQFDAEHDGLLGHTVQHNRITYSPGSSVYSPSDGLSPSQQFPTGQTVERLASSLGIKGSQTENDILNPDGSRLNVLNVDSLTVELQEQDIESPENVCSTLSNQESSKQGCSTSSSEEESSLSNPVNRLTSSPNPESRSASFDERLLQIQSIIENFQESQQHNNGSFSADNSTKVFTTSLTDSTGIPQNGISSLPTPSSILDPSPTKNLISYTSFLQPQTSTYVGNVSPLLSDTFQEFWQREKSPASTKGSDVMSISPDSSPPTFVEQLESATGSTVNQIDPVLQDSRNIAESLSLHSIISNQFEPVVATSRYSNQFEHATNENIHPEISNQFEETFRHQCEPVSRTHTKLLSPLPKNSRESVALFDLAFTSQRNQIQPVFSPPINSERPTSNHWVNIDQSPFVLPTPVNQFELPRGFLNQIIPVPSFLPKSPEPVSSRRGISYELTKELNPVSSKHRRGSLPLQNPFAKNSLPSRVLNPFESVYPVEEECISRNGDETSNEARSTGSGSGISRQIFSVSSSEDEDDNPYRKLLKRTVKSSRRFDQDDDDAIPFCSSFDSIGFVAHSLDPNDAYNQYLKCVPLQPRPENETEPFTSQDPNENRDNSPTRWGKVRELKNDTERKIFAGRQFANQEKADPTRNLTYHGHRRNRLAQERKINFEPQGGRDISKRIRIVNGYLQPISSFSSRETGRKRHREEKEFRETIPFPQFEAQLVRKLKELKFPKMLQFCSSQSRQNSYQRVCTYSKPCSYCLGRQKKNWERYLSHYKAGLIDSKNFLSFYLGKSKQGEIQVPINLLRVGIKAEKMFAQFNSIYGPNHEMWCKDCSTTHVF